MIAEGVISSASITMRGQSQRDGVRWRARMGR
jgi:hypothetical protein